MTARMTGYTLLFLYSLTLLNGISGSFDHHARHGYRATSKIRVDNNIISITSSTLYNRSLYALTDQQHVLLLNEDSGDVLKTLILPLDHHCDKIRQAPCQHSEQSCIYLWRSQSSSEQKSGEKEIFYFKEEQNDRNSPEVNSFSFKSAGSNIIHDIYGENGQLWITGEKQDGSVFQIDVNSEDQSERYRKSQVAITALSQSHKGVIFMNMTSIHISGSTDTWTQLPSLILHKKEFGQAFKDADWTNDGFALLLHGKHLQILHYEQDRSAMMLMDEASVNHGRVDLSTSTNCFDKNSNCRTWSLTGMCDRKADYMQTNCPKTCKMCGSDSSAMTGCYDSNSLCSTWAAAGRCNEEASREFMKQNCKKSCEICSSSEKMSVTPCVDKSSGCQSWAETGRCEPNKGYMTVNCPLSCNFCPQTQVQLTSKQHCEDKSDHCSSWADAGKCKTRSDYMYSNCMKSCGLCGRTEQKQNTEPACQDSSEYCLVWASHNMCSIKSKYMSERCRVACGICKEIDDSRQDSSGCYNRNDFCETWKDYDLCEKKPKFMKDNCPKSCGECDDHGRYKQSDEPEKEESCDDLNDNCDIWSKNDYCTKYTSYMNANCPAACGACKKTGDKDACSDKNKDCKSWADQGRCESRPDYMLENCRASCSSCNGGSSHNSVTEPTERRNNEEAEKQNGRKADNSQRNNEQEAEVACEDLSQYCSLWKTAGRCEDKADYMKYYCPKTCLFCSGSEEQNSEKSSDSRKPQVETTTLQTTTVKTTTTEVTTPATEPTESAEDKNCVDTNSRCESWSTAGYCPRYERYMRDNCQKSCNFCQSSKQESTTPKPTTPRPITRRTTSRNPTTRPYYGSNECKDNHSFCTTWAKQGRCQIRADFMLRMCKKSCDAC